MDKVVIFNRVEVEGALDTMALQIDNILKGQTAVLVPVMIGGLYTAMKIADRINAPVVMDPVKARSYNNQRRCGIEFDYAGCMGKDWRGRIVVLIDDIYDSGATMKFLKNEANTRRAARVITATLITKDKSAVDSWGLYYDGDEFLYGCGLDRDGFDRNVNHVYTLR